MTMKTKTFARALAMLLALTLGSFGQNKSSSSVSVSNVNGQATVTVDGKQVWSGKVTGKPSTKSASVNGTQYIAVFDDGKVVWESAPGAANRVGAPAGVPPVPGVVHQNASANVSVSNINGETTVTVDGKQVWSGKVNRGATAKSSKINGMVFIAVFDGDTVLWENVPGAAGHVRR